MQSSPKRSLLPKHHGAYHTAGVGVQSRPRPVRRKYPNTQLACNDCRRLKTKCDGRRPKCSRCSASGSMCIYATRRRAKGEAEAERDEAAFNTLQLLRTMPAAGAAELLRALRGDRDGPRRVPEAPRPALSEGALLRGMLAPTRNGLEFELMMRHPAAYPPLFPLQTATLPLESLLRPSRITADGFGRNRQRRQQSQYSIRYLPPRPLVDKRLRNLDMRRWSRVSISNELAARILSLYIETDHQTLPLFHLDLFVQDLIHHRTYFCSSLLVNALMSWACQTYVAIDSEAHELSRAFFSEAQTLIVDDGPSFMTLTSVSALTCLCIASMGYGQDGLAVQFLQESVRIGTRMGLFDVGSEDESAVPWLGKHEDWNRSASYTAWGVHNWVSLYGLRYRSLMIATPPKIAMPGTTLDENDDPDSSAATSTAATPDNTAASSISEQVFQASCKLWTICNEVTQGLHRANDCQQTSQVHDMAQLGFRRLAAWAEALPLDLVRSDLSTHAVVMMHIYYHVIIADLFRGLAHVSQEPFTIRSFATPNATPHAVYAASINQLKRLFLLFRLRFQAASLSILSQTVLIFVSNAVIEAAQGNSSGGSDQLEWQFYLRLCLAAMEDLYGSYREAGSVTRGLLNMAVKRRAVTVDEARQVTGEMVQLGSKHGDDAAAGRAVDVDTRSMVDLDLAVTDPFAAQVSNVAAQFEELMLEQKGKGNGIGNQERAPT